MPQRQAVLWSPHGYLTEALEHLRFPSEWQVDTYELAANSSSDFFPTPRELLATVNQDTDFLVLCPLSTRRDRLQAFSKSKVMLQLSKHPRLMLIGPDTLTQAYPHRRIKPCCINMHSAPAFLAAHEDTITKARQYQGISSTDPAEFWPLVEERQVARGYPLT